VRRRAILSRFLTVGSRGLFCLLLIVISSGCEEKPQEQVVELKEISAFDVPEELPWDFCGGQRAKCSENPDPNVTTYPNFVSNKPLFGSIHLPREFHRGLRGRWYCFAIDQTDTAGQSYDTLYFDLNCDLDLTNDKPLVVQQNPPKGAVISQTLLKQQICFDYLTLEFPFGDKGTRPLEIMPRFVVDQDDDPYLALVTTKAFKGTVDIAGQSYEVWLGHNRAISGWFDHPSTELHFFPKGDFSRRNPLSTTLLMEWRRIGKTDYRFSASPSGDKLIVRPYQGKYGTMKVDPVNSPIKRARISGALYSGEAVFWLGGEFDKYGSRKPVPSSRVPVGDYTAGLEIYLDDLHISTGANIHSDGCRAAHIDGPHVLSVKIREDEPFILDFSNKPEIFFTSPPKSLRLRLGEQLQVEAVLIDPKLDIMITDFEKEKVEFGFASPDSDWTFLSFHGIASGVGIAVILWLLSVIIHSKRRIFLVLAGLATAITVGSAVVYCVVNIEHDYDDISPSVTIARSNGEIVASGVMPFG
jgi:hypothetical protein